MPTSTSTSTSLAPAVRQARPGLASPLAPGGLRWRPLAALVLRQASRWLARAARQLAARRADARPQRPPVLEFYAEAGAPEGALYLDGELLGHLPGVTRL